ncbi:MAG: hypothetical protein ACT6FG_00370 [Methanosarcinaceae archaeon]
MRECGVVHLDFKNTLHNAIIGELEGIEHNVELITNAQKLSNVLITMICEEISRSEE